MKTIWMRAAAALLCACMMLSAVACTPAEQTPEDPSTEGTNTPNNGTAGGTETDDLSVDRFDPKKEYPLVDYFALDMSEYVQLGRYTKLTLTVDPAKYAVADSAVQSKLNAILLEHHPDAKITDRPAAMGDTVVVDYVGKLDGVAFEGGTAYKQTIKIEEENGYIDGFVAGIVGISPGEMKEVAVTFPDNYGNKDLAGKPAIFEMTVHHIIGKPALTDDFVVSYTEGKLSTAEELKAAVRTELEEEARFSVLRSALWSKINEISAVTSYPEDAVMYYYSYYYTLYSQYAAMYDMTYENFLKANGMTPQYIFESCQNMVKQDLVRHAIYADGGYVCTDEQYNAQLDEYTAENYESLRASMIASGEKDYTIEQARAYFDEAFGSQLRDTCLDTIATEALLEIITIEEKEVSSGSGS